MNQNYGITLSITVHNGIFKELGNHNFGEMVDIQIVLYKKI